MAWKTINGHRYYYRSRREGERVVTDYVGRGELAELAAEIDAFDHLEREQERQYFRYERELRKTIRNELDTYQDAVRALVATVLVSNGYHAHKGQWRKKRE